MEARLNPTNAVRTFRERRLAVGRGILDLQRATGIHRGRLSQIELGIYHTFAEHEVIEAALLTWEAERLGGRAS